MSLELASRPTTMPAPMHLHVPRAEEPATPHWFACILDQIDYGIAAVAADGRLLHANGAARRQLRGEQALWFEPSGLRARCAEDQSRLQHALEAAATRGLRSLLSFGREAARITIAVVPIAGPDRRGAALLVLGKPAVCEELSVQCFARAHGLTPAEVQVLRLLCDGAQPGEIAAALRVAVSTIRSQVSSLRAKTGARSIGALVRQVALLPPLVHALQAAAKA